MRRGELRVGCSGWQYEHWRGRFYPADAPTSQWLERYAQAFDTVEINGSFYKLPARACAERWASRVPPGFLFAWKASRFLTHMKKLKDPRDPVRLMLGRARGLGAKLGPILFQLPTGFSKNLERLRGLLRVLPAAGRYAVELREPSWYDRDVFDALERAGVAMCLHDMPGSAVDRVETAPFVYVRFHGAAGRYRGGYDAATLRRRAAWLGDRLDAGVDVYAYFNNDEGGHAPVDALRLRRMLGADLSLSPPPRPAARGGRGARAAAGA